MTDRFTIHGVSSEALHQHVLDRFSAALDQHEDHVKSVMVRVEDLNGRKGGVDDKRCQAIVVLANSGNIVVDERGSETYSVVSVAADRVKQVVGRHVQKATEKRRRSA
jgi:ribosome-associated translation inhibitor RaiA